MTFKTLTDKKNLPVKNPTVPLILSFVGCLCFAVLIIVVGYHHGHMSISAVLKNL